MKYIIMFKLEAYFHYSWWI